MFENSKSNTRLALVQGYYSSLIDNSLDFSESVSHSLTSMKNDGFQVKKNFSLEMIEFINNEEEVINSVIPHFLNKHSSVEELMPLMRSIIVIAFAEMMKDEKTESAILINEYTEIAKSYFGSSESGFINAVLDKFCKNSRKITS